MDTSAKTDNTASDVLLGSDTPSIFASEPFEFILDQDWAKQAFLISVADDDSIDIKNRSYSSASLKFTDTTIGGSYVINPRPQYTRYSDIRNEGRLAGRDPTTVSGINGNNGMGRYYSEALDDTQQHIYMRFGVPQYNSLTQFFTGFYNLEAGRLARTGRTSTFFTKAGQVLGLIGQIIIWPILVMQAVGHVVNFFLDKQSSKFYYMKPTMLLYWGAVSSIVNKISVGKGILPGIRVDETQKIGKAYALDSQYVALLSQMLPDIIDKDGYFDIYAIAAKAQRMKIKSDKAIYDAADAYTGSDFTGFVKKWGEEKVVRNSHDMAAGKSSWVNRVQDWLKTEVTLVKNADTEASAEIDMRSPVFNEAINSVVNGVVNTATSTTAKVSNSLHNFKTYLTTELDDGSAFAGFRVDYTGPVSESFSNSVRDSDLSSKINGMSGSARETKFSFAGGSNLGGSFGSVIDAGTNAIKDLATGILDTVHMSGLMALAGNAFVDIPKHWDNSSASLPKSSYTVRLSSPYGNPISQLINIYIPLAMLLAAALPLSTGKQSFTSPFLVELYDKGRHQTRLGMFDSLSITRGVSNLGFNKQGQAMAIDVSFSIVDMSSIMHMQLSQGISVTSDDGIFDEETVFSDYMNTLSSLGLHEQFHRIPKLALRYARFKAETKKLHSPAFWAQMVAQKTPVGWLEVLYRGTNR
jgi:hypothetical protein